ncbi:hypothetical protein ColLi_13103 [Colletotrichum liriopes]|uniref:Uncharacterized protein n=1 Tax=Colletotrichum liriopes TaxID=708192 RepID=A0AA37LYE7_9PEZI|nr:hypothetical protein ColLi_13103 [Colletotrichum liriopes]
MESPSPPPPPSSLSPPSAIDGTRYKHHGSDNTQTAAPCYRLNLALILPEPLGMQPVSLCFHTVSTRSAAAAAVLHFHGDDIAVTTSLEDADAHDPDQGYVFDFDPFILDPALVKTPRQQPWLLFSLIPRRRRVCALALAILAWLVAIACGVFIGRLVWEPPSQQLQQQQQQQQPSQTRPSRYESQNVVVLQPQRVVIGAALRNITNAYVDALGPIVTVHSLVSTGEVRRFWPLVALSEYEEEATELCYYAGQADADSPREWCLELVHHLDDAVVGLSSATASLRHTSPWLFQMQTKVRLTMLGIKLAWEWPVTAASNDTSRGNATVNSICDAFLDQMPLWDKDVAAIITTLDKAHQAIVAAKSVAPAIYEKFFRSVGERSVESPLWWVEDVLYSLMYLTRHHGPEAEAVADTVAGAIAGVEAAHADLTSLATHLEQVKEGSDETAWYFDDWDSVLQELAEVVWNLNRLITAFPARDGWGTRSEYQSYKGLRPRVRRQQEVLKRPAKEHSGLLRTLFGRSGEP